MEQKIINARIRTETGKSVAKRMRKAGRLPAVMYNSEGKGVLLEIDEKEFARLFHLITESTLIAVKTEGAKDVIAFVKDVQYDILTEKIKHIDFYEVDPAKILRTKITIRLTGSPEGIRLGGVLEFGTQEIEVECLPKDLPERIIVDVSNLQLNHSVHVRDIKLAEGIKLLTDPELTVATLKYIKVEIPAEEAETTEAPAADSEEAAAPTPPAK